jgi:hypothetical protein
LTYSKKATGWPHKVFIKLFFFINFFIKKYFLKMNKPEKKREGIIEEIGSHFQLLKDNRGF